MKQILFNTLMVSAVDDGRKTATRRLVKTAIPASSTVCCRDNKWYWSFWQDGDYHLIKQPYDVGDILYVRETWQKVSVETIKDNVAHLHYRAPGGGFNQRCVLINWDTIPKIAVPDEENSFYIYRATNVKPLSGYLEPSWRPSIHMPKTAARTFLKVKSVRLEKLQDITEEQAKAEGVPQGNYFKGSAEIFFELRRDGYYTAGFEWIWNNTIKEEDVSRYGWDANPWVWVIEFEKINDIYD